MNYILLSLAWLLIALLFYYLVFLLKKNGDKIIRRGIIGIFISFILGAVILVSAVVMLAE